MNRISRYLVAWTSGALLAASLASGAAAQGFPGRPVNIVVPFAAGGPSDVVTRKVAAEMAKSLGQPVIVDNRPGASGQIGADVVIRSPADGYTLLFLGAASSASPAIVKTPRLHMGRDVDPVSTLYGGALVLMVNAQLPVRNVKEFIAYANANAKADGASLAAGTSQSLSLLATKVFMQHAGVRLNPIPYKGSSPTAVDLARGEVGVAIDAVSAYLPFIESGKIRPLMVGGAKRLAVIPDVPTSVEAGLPQLRTSFTSGLWVPKGTPKEVVAKLNRAVVDAVATDDVQKFARSMSFDPRSSTPEAYGSEAAAELAFWTKAAQDVGFVPE